MAKDKKNKLDKGRIKVRVLMLEHGKGLPLPDMQSSGAAGLDLVAALDVKKPLRIAPGKWALVPTGLAIALPRGTEAQVRPRSGLAMKHGVTVLNSPGTIDSDYRGEVQVILINLGNAAFVVRRGERIAQMVIAAHASIKIRPVEELPRTKRGDGGFGSTGIIAPSVTREEKKKPLPARVKSARSKRPRSRDLSE